MRLLLLLIVIISLIGCAKFKEGECIQNTSDSTIYRITSVHFKVISASYCMDITALLISFGGRIE